MIATSQSDRLWLALLTYGLGVGIAVACAYVPMVAMVGGWFERQRTLALGIAVTGIGLGTLTVAPVAAKLIENLGWRHTYLVLGLAGAAVLASCAIVVTPPPRSNAPGALRLGQALRDDGYQRLYIATMLLGIPLFVPFVHLPTYAVEVGIDPVAAAGLVGVIGAASIVGRLGLGPVAKRVGPLRAFQSCFLAMGSSFALWLVGSGYLVLAAFAVILGIGYGGFVALGPAVVADRFGPQSLGGLLGFLYTSAGIGSAIGAPAVGLLTDAAGSFRPAILACLIIRLGGVRRRAVSRTLRGGRLPVAKDRTQRR